MSSQEPHGSIGVLISEAQGMCTDERPHEEINEVLDRAQRALETRIAAATAEGYADGLHDGRQERTRASL